MIDVFNSFLADALRSDFFAGGLALGAFGIVAATLRLGLIALYRIFMRRVWVSLTLDNRSAAYRHFCIWMEHNNVLAKSRHVRMTDGRWASGTKGYAPAPGRHWFVWRGKICRLERNINEKSKVGSAHNQRPMETLHVTVLFGHVSAILEWIGSGRQIALWCQFFWLAERHRRGRCARRACASYGHKPQREVGPSPQCKLLYD